MIPNAARAIWPWAGLDGRGIGDTPAFGTSQDAVTQVSILVGDTIVVFTATANRPQSSACSVVAFFFDAARVARVALFSGRLWVERAETRGGVTLLMPAPCAG